MAGEVTHLLERARSGDAKASDELFVLVQTELRRIAEAQMRHERSDHTLQATALVNEAYIRLAGREQLRFEDRAHFTRVVSQVMRRLLVDHARARGRLKRGGKAKHDRSTPLDQLVDRAGVDLVALNEALDILARLSPRQAELVELRFFGGFTAQEAADILGVSKRTADDDWKMARAWLASKLSDDEISRKS
ncbi:MAG: sigma-70 family RNA polymerase sigma factor [Planctomycetota bacterium]|nr:MAG: sigma-70 family RNA polymerase sigma factor [Planctomycetota bacterium]